MDHLQYILFFGLLFAAASALPANTREENEVGDRIHADVDQIEVMKATYGQRPFQVFVTDKYHLGLCGGVLIEWNYVLTAAHCINQYEATIGDFRKFLGVVVKAGIIKNIGDPEEQKQEVTLDLDHIIFSAGWKGGSGMEGTMDLALLKLNEPFVSNDGKAARIKIYEKSADTLVDQPITISGWGITDDPPEGKPVYTEDLLVSTINHETTKLNNEFLVLTDDDGSVSCGGDSGGPATTTAGGDEAMLVGITHAGINHCGHDDKLSLYTSVYKYLGWICLSVDEKDNIAGACERILATQTCDDGIMNQDETEVDCGGTICDICVCEDKGPAKSPYWEDEYEECEKSLQLCHSDWFSSVCKESCNLCGEACVNTNDGKTDSNGRDCRAYDTFYTYCGQFDDDDFDSQKMCCSCFGGTKYDPENPTVAPPTEAPPKPDLHTYECKDSGPAISTANGAKFECSASWGMFCRFAWYSDACQKTCGTCGEACTSDSCPIGTTCDDLGYCIDVELGVWSEQIRDRTWHKDQCGHSLGLKHGITSLIQCKNECVKTEGCTAISVNLDFTMCSLRGCEKPVTTDLWVEAFGLDSYILLQEPQ